MRLVLVEGPCAPRFAAQAGSQVRSSIAKVAVCRRRNSARRLPWTRRRRPTAAHVAVTDAGSERKAGNAAHPASVAQEGLAACSNRLVPGLRRVLRARVPSPTLAALSIGRTKVQTGRLITAAVPRRGVHVTLCPYPLVTASCRHAG